MTAAHPTLCTIDGMASNRTAILMDFRGQRRYVFPGPG